MGFFSDGDVRSESPRGRQGKPSLKLLHDLQCSVCPLSSASCLHPKMLPTGSARPDILVLGEAPGEEEDKNSEQFVGKSGKYLRAQIPREWLPRMRFDNTVRCRPPQNRTPDDTEMEACRPRHIADVEKTKPKAIFGFGQVPLAWANGASGVAKWRGRRSPVRVGSHTCWMYFFNHPSFLLRQKSESGKYTEEERMFALDLRRALADVGAGLEEPEFYTRDDTLAGVEILYGKGGDSDVDRLARFLSGALLEERVGVDYETNGKRPYLNSAKILTISVSTPQKTLAFALDHRGAKWTRAQRDEVLGLWLWFIQQPGPRKAVHNLAFEEEWNAVLFGTEYVRGSRWDCTMAQAFVIDQRIGDKHGGQGGDDEGTLECFSLGFLSLLHFGLDIKTLFRLKMDDLDSEPVENVLTYNGVDSKFHRMLLVRQDTIIERMGLTHIYEHHLRRIPTCVLTQVKGVPLDFAVASELNLKYEDQVKKLTAGLEQLPSFRLFAQKTGRKFKWSSDKDVMFLFKDLLNREEVRQEVRKGGGTEVRYTTNESALSRIDDPVAKAILDLRGVSKQASTYTFPEGHEHVWPDGMLHPLLNTCRARTSRLTSSDPNEQNWPKRDAAQKEMRKQFVAQLKGSASNLVMVSVDQGQIEARVFAMASQDKVYTQMLWEGYDTHMEWAERIAKQYPRFLDQFKGKSPMKEARQLVKSDWVFAQFFGAQLETSARRLKVPSEVLEPLHRQFWKTFSGLKDWQDRNNKFYQDHGYVELLTGRRRCGPLGFNVRINTPIQGTAAEITMDSMIRVSEIEDWYLQPILQIHDDLTLVFPMDEMYESRAEIVIAETIRPTFDFINVPLVAEMSVGPNLYDMEEVGKYSSAEWYGREAHLGLRA